MASSIGTAKQHCTRAAFPAPARQLGPREAEPVAKDAQERLVAGDLHLVSGAVDLERNVRHPSYVGVRHA